MDNVLELYFFNVGHGDSIAIKFPDNSWGIIDCNRTSETINPQVLTFLNKQNIEKICFICITHPHFDHIRGIDTIEKAFHEKIDKIYLYGLGTGSPCENRKDQALFKMLMSATDNARNPHKVNVLNVGYEELIGGVKLKVLSPNEPIRNSLLLKNYANKYSDYNKESLVMLLEYKDRQILFTGDITSNIMETILHENPNINADIIKISHHGSSLSNDFSILEKCVKKNGVAIISTDGGLKYSNIPSQEVITYLQRNLFCNVLLTNELGQMDSTTTELYSNNDGIDAISEIITEKIPFGYYKVSVFDNSKIEFNAIIS